MNPLKREDLAEKPTKAIISLKNDRGTNYETYLEVYNELKAAYREIWDAEGQKRHGKDYEYSLAHHVPTIRWTYLPTQNTRFAYSIW